MTTDGIAGKASYDLKLDRAETHLVELEVAIERYANGHPYEIRARASAKPGQVEHYLHFTRQPDPMLAVIVGDFIYNVRSALDHLRAALVPRARERRGYFPLYFDGVWEDHVVGESEERARQRNRWRTDTDGMAPGAVEILKTLQAHGANDADGNPGPLAALNRIAIKDRHTKVPVVASALVGITGSCRTPDGMSHVVRPLPKREGVREDAEVFLPDGATDVVIEGTPTVMVRVSSEDSGLKVPDAFREALLPGTREVVEQLRPFARD